MECGQQEHLALSRCDGVLSLRVALHARKQKQSCCVVAKVAASQRLGGCGR
jgi:hypothetical protein